MHHRWQFGVLAGALLLLLAAPGAQASKLGVYFDEYGQESRLQVNSGQPFQFFVAASDISEPIKGFEFLVSVDPTIIVTGREIPYPTAINVMSAEDNWVVGLGIEDGVFVSGYLTLIRYSAVLLSEAEGLRIGLGPPDYSGAPRVPQYLLDGSRLLEFDVVTGASINAETESWGTLKDNFKDQ